MADAKVNQKHARDYWQSVDADNEGMLGGFGYISEIDLQGSREFLHNLGIKLSERTITRAVDCGAGIGRITNGLLLELTTTVDIVEPVTKFSNTLKKTPGIGQIFNVGLENWSPTQKYDLIWNQWCLGHLSDKQLQAYLKKCARILLPNGLIVVKENLSTNRTDIFDDLDSSVTRSGLKIKMTEIQKGFPRGLFPVKIYALIPKEAE